MMITKLKMNICNSTRGKNVHTCIIELTIEIFLETAATATDDGSSYFPLNANATIQPKEYPNNGRIAPHK